MNKHQEDYFPLQSPHAAATLSVGTPKGQSPICVERSITVEQNLLLKEAQDPLQKDQRLLPR
jgi:hypothetical protein